MDTEKTLKKLKRFKTCSYIIERLMLGYALLFLIVVVCFSFQIIATTEGMLEEEREWISVCWGQSAVAAFIGYLIFRQVTKVLEESIEAGSVFLPGHARRLRIVAGELIALALFAFVCSLLVSALSNKGFPILFNLFLDGSGLPSWQEWHEALRVPTDNYSRGNYIAGINMLPVFIAIVIWALSYVFEYGAALQREIDLTL